MLYNRQNEKGRGMKIFYRRRTARGLAVLGTMMLTACLLPALQQPAAGQSAEDPQAPAQPTAAAASTSAARAARDRIYLKAPGNSGADRVDRAQLRRDLARQQIALVEKPSAAALVLNVWHNAHGFLGVMRDRKGSIVWTGSESTQAALEKGIVSFVQSLPWTGKPPSQGRSAAGKSRKDSERPLSASTLMNGHLHQVGGKKVTPPVLVYKPKPPYTQAAKRRGLEGSVDLVIEVDAKGNVTTVKEHGDHLGAGLDASAIKTVRRWKFKPAERDGVPVAVRIIVEVGFRLRQNPTIQSD